MTEGRYRVTRKRAPDGIALAFLALFLQVLLPFFVVLEIATLSDPAAAETAAICSHSGTHHEGGVDQTNHGACPLCIALSTAQHFTDATHVAVPVPQEVATIELHAVAARLVATIAAAPYQSRAPPFIG